MLAINTKKPKLNANYNILGEKNRKPLNSRARQGVLKLNTKSRITQKGKLTNWTSSKFETSLYKSPREDETSYGPATDQRKVSVNHTRPQRGPVPGTYGALGPAQQTRTANQTSA